MRTVILLGVLFSTMLWAVPAVVTSDIVKDTRWSGEILVRGDLVIHKTATLYVSPGTRILFEARKDIRESGKSPQRVELVVLGRILADGKEGDGKIIFRPNAVAPAVNDWYGIIVKGGQKVSRFRHCVIEYAYTGITCYGSSPEIASSEVQFNQYIGISCEVRSYPFIRKTMILGNQFAGINSELDSRPIIEQCIVSGNTNGVVISRNSSVDLGSMDTANGSSRGENLIYTNEEMNIYNYSGQKIYAQNNIWYTEAHLGIQETLFDQTNRRVSGEVIFLPIFSHQNSPKQNPPKKSSVSAVLVKKKSRRNRRPFSEPLESPQKSISGNSPAVIVGEVAERLRQMGAK